MKVSSVHDVITAVVAALKLAVTYPVFDGPVSNRPGRAVDRFAVIGAEDVVTSGNEEDQVTSAATMDQLWSGLGQKSREENLHIECVAVGKSSTVSGARAIAMAVVQDVSDNLGTHPTPETYNALVSAIASIRSRNAAGGAIVYVQFTISAQARQV